VLIQCSFRSGAFLFLVLGLYASAAANYDYAVRLDTVPTTCVYSLGTQTSSSSSPVEGASTSLIHGRAFGQSLDTGDHTHCLRIRAEISAHRCRRDRGFSFCSLEGALSSSENKTSWYWLRTDLGCDAFPGPTDGERDLPLCTMSCWSLSVHACNLA
jgi:hypothetical protein